MEKKLRKCYFLETAERFFYRGINWVEGSGKDMKSVLEEDKIDVIFLMTRYQDTLGKNWY